MTRKKKVLLGTGLGGGVGALYGYLGTCLGST